MRSQHLELANFKGTAEKLVETLAAVGGMGAGILAAIVLGLAWQPTEYDRIILKLFSGTRLQGSAQRGADHALVAEG